MALGGDLAPIAPIDATLRGVESEADWAILRELVEADFGEGGRSGDVTPRGVVSGLFAGYRAKREFAPFYIAEASGVPCAYACAAHCPDGVGIIDDLFTLPAFRGRGIASGLIAHGVARLRAAGARNVFIGALARERAKRLYAKLGFAPLMISRKWVKR
jgi:GNAT superfamily N-acetyltransferase